MRNPRRFPAGIQTLTNDSGCLRREHDQSSILWSEWTAESNLWFLPEKRLQNPTGSWQSWCLNGNSNQQQSMGSQSVFCTLSRLPFRTRRRVGRAIVPIASIAGASGRKAIGHPRPNRAIPADRDSRERGSRPLNTDRWRGASRRPNGQGVICTPGVRRGAGQPCVQADGRRLLSHAACA